VNEKPISLKDKQTGRQSLMTSTQIPPNELADLYESLYTMLDALPSETHPAWELAIESVLFGGEGLASDAVCYGEQQAERNDFKISDYRAQHGDGEHIHNYPTLTTRPPTDQDTKSVDEEIQLPVAPESETVLPLFVDAETLPDAISLLNEFPAAPTADSSGRSTEILLDPDRFPGLTASSVSHSKNNQDENTRQLDPDHAALPPNELADIYDALFTVLEAIPDEAHPTWKEAIESVLFGGKYLLPDANAYGEQQGERNGFAMPDYRGEYGDGDRVTDFPTIPTAGPLDADAHHVDADIEIPVAPESETVLPLDPSADSLADAVSLLEEFPAEPDAEIDPQGIDSLLDTDALYAHIDDAIPTTSTEASSTTQSTSDGTTDPTTDSSQPANSDTNAVASTERSDSASPADSGESSTTESTVLRHETAGESTVPLEERDTSGSDTPRKYEDSDAERAHRRAQQRDPSDVVELGDEITLTLKQVDYSSHPPTIMGTKNRLVIFVIDAPQDLSQYDTIRATVVDYGGKNNSAEAAFSGYVN
jgi:hypothetical protein